MKALMLLCSFVAALAMAGNDPMPVGYHEFGVFGSGPVYLSHFPMFSSIHAYQAVVEAKLVGDRHDAEARYVEARAQHPAALFIASPYRNVPVTTDRKKDQEDWILPDKMQVGQRFNVDLHYVENKTDHPLDANVSVEVTRVIDLRRLDPGVGRPAHLAYFVLGTPAEAYLVHYVSAPPDPGAEVPDFDQVLEVKLDTTAASASRFEVVDRDNKSEKRLKVGEKAELTNADGAKVHVEVTRELFNHSIMTER